MATITNPLNTYFWNYTKTQGLALINKGLEVCTQQKVGNSLWNVGVVAITGAAAAGSATVVSSIFHRLAIGAYRMMYPEDERVQGRKSTYSYDGKAPLDSWALKIDLSVHSTLFNIVSIIFSGCAFVTGAAVGYQVALKINHKLEIFSADDVIKFTLYPLFASTVFVFVPSNYWSGVVTGIAGALPAGALSGVLKSHSLYITAFSAALFGSELSSALALLYNKFH